MATKLSGVNDSRRVTLDHIATLAGVSPATVSKVLNGRRGVSVETRERVGALLAEHDYRRRGTLTRSQVGLVDLVFPGLEGLWAHDLLVGAEAEASRAGVGLVVSKAHQRLVGNRHWLRQITARRTDGIVLVSSHLLPGAAAELARLRMPLVQIDPVGDFLPDVPSVAVTNWAGALSATEHLTSLGHRRIGIVGGPVPITCSQDRMAGYHAGLHRAGLPRSAELETEGDFVAASGRRAGERLLSLPDRPTAIFATSDEMAFGVYQAAAAHGLRIPEDLSVVGFDDTELCGWMQPRLTTVRQPLREMAVEATRLVLALARQEQPSVGRRELATSLVVRGSTAPPRR